MSDLTVADICAHVVDRESLPTTVRGRESAVTEYQTTRQATTSEKWLKAPDKFRVETLSVDEWDEIEMELDVLNPFDTIDFGGVGSFTVQNGAKVLSYNDAQNSSKIYDFDSAEGVSVMTSSLIEGVVSETFDVSAEGTSTVAGHDCYVLSSTPTDSAGALLSRIDTYRLWADKEYGYPLQQEYEYQLQDGTYVVRRQFEEIEFDSDIADGIFDCTPPESSTLIK